MFLGFTGILPFLGIIPARIAERKGRSGFGWWIYGTTLFVVALPHALILKEKDDAAEFIDKFRPCPSCSKTIRSDAGFCRFCKHAVPLGERLDEDASTASLIRSLNARDTDVREKAIILLGDRGPSAYEALPALRRLCDDSTRRIRIRAEWAVERVDTDESSSRRSLESRIEDTANG
jgi:HEAT repeat protein